MLTFVSAARKLDGVSNKTKSNAFPLFTSALDISSFFSVFFSTGLVRLYIAGLPLRSCQTVGAPSVQGSAQCPFFHFWLQQDLNLRPGAYHADVLPLLHFDPQIYINDILNA